MSAPTQSEIVIGVIANPASGRDVRRLAAKASVFPTAEKACMVERVLGPFGALGIGRVLLMPDRSGIAASVQRAIAARPPGQWPHWPRVELVDMPIEGDASDSIRAARAMRDAGARLIVVLGGDGTHRVVADACPELPLATLSSGTNNVFPELREATVTGLAAALFATGRVPAAIALRRNKILRVNVGARSEPAVVDVCVTRLPRIGSRAVWDPETITELFVTFAEPDAIGLSSIAAMAEPVGRGAPYGAFVRCGAGGREITAAIAPGLLAQVPIAEVRRMLPGRDYAIHTRHGSIALDGEREIELHGGPPASVRLDLAGPFTLDVPATLAEAVRTGQLSRPARDGAAVHNEHAGALRARMPQPVMTTTNQERRPT